MSEDLRRLEWPELLALLRDQTSYWLLAYNTPSSPAWERRPPALETIKEDNAAIGEAAFEIARRVAGHASGALPNVRAEDEHAA